MEERNNLISTWLSVPLCLSYIVHIYMCMSFPGDSDGKESACNAGDSGSISRLRRSPGERLGYPL